MGEKVENVEKPLGKIFLNNFIGGIAWSFGATAGIAIIFVVLSFVLSKINLVPIVGTFVAQVINFILRNNSTLVR